jgi:hypothetical protein
MRICSLAVSCAYNAAARLLDSGYIHADDGGVRFEVNTSTTRSMPLWKTTRD